MSTPPPLPSQRREKTRNIIVGIVTVSLFLLGVLVYALSFLPRTGGSAAVAAAQACPKLIFDYPLLATYYPTATIQQEEHVRYGQEGILVIPLYPDGSPYGTQRRLATHINIGSPILLMPDENRRFGDTVREAAPEALEAEVFVFFVKGCPPVAQSAYFPCHVERVPSTNQPQQWLGVYPLPAEQMQRLNRVLLRELTSGETIRIRRYKQMIPFETALQTESFFSYDSIAWPRECVEEEYAAKHRPLTSGAYAMMSMFSWGSLGDQATATPRFTDADKALLRRFLEDAPAADTTPSPEP